MGAWALVLCPRPGWTAGLPFPTPHHPAPDAPFLGNQCAPNCCPVPPPREARRSGKAAAPAPQGPGVLLQVSTEGIQVTTGPGVELGRAGGCHLRRTGHLGGGTPEALKGSVWGLGAAVGVWVPGRLVPAPGQPAKEAVNPQSRIKETSRESKEFPALGPAIFLLLRNFPWLFFKLVDGA